MLAKCIGIISYFPDGELGNIRREKFNKLLNTLNIYFNLPIIIIAQNWKKEDYNLKYDNQITVYSYPQGLGITKARIELRNKILLNHPQYDYIIMLDDDVDIECTQELVSDYFNQIEFNPNKVGLFYDSHQILFAISSYMLKIMDYDFIKNLEASRGEIWEDVAWVRSYHDVYPDKFFTFKSAININYKKTENTTDSTWYNSNINQGKVFHKTKLIKNNWVNYLRKENKWNLL